MPDVRLAAPPRYAYLGPRGTFTEAALRQLPDVAGADLIACASVAHAMDAVRGRDADSAVVPIENSVEGSVAATVDELTRGQPLVIVRELTVEIQFALMARRGTGLSDVRRVATHPHAEAQTRTWVADHLPRADVVLEASTARAAELVAAGEEAYDAAIAAPIAAATYGLATLDSDVADTHGAVTRFVQVSRPVAPPEPTGADKTSLVAFIHDNHPGALLEVLEQFATRGVDLCRLESRPTGSALGEYCFSIDAKGHVSEARVGEALMGLRRTCRDVRFLGSYPRADGEATRVPASASDLAHLDSRDWLHALRTPGA